MNNENNFALNNSLRTLGSMQTLPANASYLVQQDDLLRQRNNRFSLISPRSKSIDIGNPIRLPNKTFIESFDENGKFFVTKLNSEF